jgi:hypothetical protein
MQFLFILFLSVVTIGCMQSNRNYNEKWGLRSIEYEENLIFKNESYTHEIVFTPKISSEKYEMRLFYPSIHYEKWFTSETDSIGKEIRKSLDNFEYELYKVNTNKLLIKNKISINNSFNQNKPLSLWLATKIKLNKNSQYRVLLHLPILNENLNINQNVVFVIGIAHDVFL